jgi:catechol 2,3-dioxygenase-like lactoylglutathione lyase family enzyme
MESHEKRHKLATRCIHAGDTVDPATGAVMPPIYTSTTFRQKAFGEPGDYVYSRVSNPTRDALERCVAALESGARGLAFSSGMAATSTVLELLDAGAHVDARRNDENGTPLSGALCTENVEVIRVLLAAGADIHAPCGWQEGTVLQQADQICENYPRCGEDIIRQIATLVGAAAGREVPSRTPIGNPIPLLFVSDFPAALNFYQEKLGFRVAWTSGDDDDPYGSIVRGNTDLHITVCKCEGNAHVGRLWVRIHSPDVDRLHAELVDKGVKMIKGPTTEPWDLREFTFNDPDGNRFVFFNFVD